jgi:hypothetical protein
VELTWGKLTLACSPLRGTDGLCASGRSAGLPGKRDVLPGLGRTRGPAQRAGPQDHFMTGEGSVVRQLTSSNGSHRTRPQKAGGLKPREQRPDSAVRCPPARSDSEAKSNQKSRHALEAEAAWAASDNRGKARTAPVSLGPNAGQLRPEPPRRLIRCMPLHFFLSPTRQGSSLLLNLPLR